MVDLPVRFAEAAPKLRTIFQQQSMVAAGSLHMLGLDALKERLGARWPAVASRVFLVVERLLAQTLGPADAWFRYDEERYIVVFAHMDRTQAGLLCAGIVSQLQKTLLGDADTASIKVHCAVDQMGADVVFQTNTLKDLLEEAARRMHEASADKPTAPEEAPASPWAPPPWAVNAAAAERATVEVLYRPVWDRPHNVLSIYIARAMLPRRGRLPRWGYDCIDDPEDFQQILDLDRRVLELALDTHAELYRNQFRYFLAVPVHFETLASQVRRRQYLTVLRQIPGELRSFLYFTIVGLPAGVPASRVADLASALRPFSRALIATVDVNCTDLPALAAAGVQIAHVVLPPGARPARWGVDLARFAHEAGRNRLHTSIEGVDVPTMAACAEAAGFHYLSGEVIGSWAEVPEHILHFTTNDLHERAGETIGGY